MRDLKERAETLLFMNKVGLDTKAVIRGLLRDRDKLRTGLRAARARLGRYDQPAALEAINKALGA